MFSHEVYEFRIQHKFLRLNTEYCLGQGLFHVSIETLRVMKGEDAFAWLDNYSEITTMIPDLIACAAGAPAPGILHQSDLGIAPLVTPRVAVLYHAPTGDCKMFAEFIAKGASNLRCMIMGQNKPLKWL